MARDIILIGGCPQCHSDELACRYNHFEKDALWIISWEHKCPNCGFRETKAYRSDDVETAADAAAEEAAAAPRDPGVCPYCARPAPL